MTIYDFNKLCLEENQVTIWIRFYMVGWGGWGGCGLGCEKQSKGCYLGVTISLRVLKLLFTSR